MRHFRTHGDDDGGRPAHPPGRPPHVAIKSTGAETTWRSRPLQLLLLSGIVLACGIAAGTYGTLSNQRNLALADKGRELQNLSLVLAEYTDRAFHAVEVVEEALAEQMKMQGIDSAEAYERQMSGHDIHLMLKDKTAGMPYVGSLTLINAQGQLFNFSRYWPLPNIDVTDREFFRVLKSNPQLTSYIGEPVVNRASGTWTVHLVRKVVGPKGEFLGLILGAMEMDYFERYFKTIALGDGSSIWLVRRDGKLLASHPHVGAQPVMKKAAITNVISAVQAGAPHLTEGIDGRERLEAARRLNNYPAMVAVSRPTDAILASWKSQALYMGSAAVMAVLVIGGLILAGARQVARKLREQNLQLDIALNNMRQGLLLFDADSRLVLWNDRYVKMYDLPPDALTPGMPVRDLLCLRKANGTFDGDPDQYISKLIDHGNVETKFVQTPDKRMICVTNARLPDGGWVSTHDDVSEQRRAEQDRDRSQKFLTTLIEAIPVTILVKEPHELRYILVNKAAEELWGLPRRKMIGKTAYDFFPKPTADLLTAQDRQTIEANDQCYSDTHEITTPNNISHLVTSRRLTIVDEAGEPQYLLNVIEDVTERTRAEERIAHMAHHDALTDLPNRILLRERLEAGIAHARRGKPLAVHYFDLDHFKTINDTFGHPMGDEVLKAVADRLRSGVRETDTIARLGGDEFAVVQTDLQQPSDAADLAEKMRDLLKAPYDIDGHRIVLDVSIGIACAPADGDDPDQLLKNADMALYGAKADGRGTCRFFEAAMDARMKVRHALETDLRNALANGEIQPHYQPLVNLATKEICGVEALMRWNHPERGLVPPAEFIPVAEETGLIVALGELTLRQACLDAVHWPAHIKVAVNLSPIQLINQNLVTAVVNALAASGLAPERLELEITEAILMQNTELALTTLHQLRNFGVRIAMDDFGTGYSSLSYLRSFPFDKIKIDRSFIVDLKGNQDSLAIVRAITHLASHLDMTTTAEGVETQQQLETVTALGCTEMQGFVFSAARPAHEITRLFRSQSASTDDDEADVA